MSELIAAACREAYLGATAEECVAFDELKPCVRERWDRVAAVRGGRAVAYKTSVTPKQAHSLWCSTPSEEDRNDWQAVIDFVLANIEPIPAPEYAPEDVAFSSRVPELERELAQARAKIDRQRKNLAALYVKPENRPVVTQDEIVTTLAEIARAWNGDGKFRDHEAAAVYALLQSRAMPVAVGEGWIGDPEPNTDDVAAVYDEDDATFSSVLYKMIRNTPRPTATQRRTMMAHCQAMWKAYHKALSNAATPTCAPTDAQIETLAKVLHDAYRKHLSSQIAWEEINTGARIARIDQARAALAHIGGELERLKADRNALADASIKVIDSAKGEINALKARVAELDAENTRVNSEWAESVKTLKEYRSTSNWHARQTSGGDAPEADLYSEDGLLAHSMDYEDAERVATAFEARVDWLTGQIDEWQSANSHLREQLTVAQAALDATSKTSAAWAERAAAVRAVPESGHRIQTTPFLPTPECGALQGETITVALREPVEAKALEQLAEIAERSPIDGDFTDLVRAILAAAKPEVDVDTNELRRAYYDGEWGRFKQSLNSRIRWGLRPKMIGPVEVECSKALSARVHTDGGDVAMWLTDSFSECLYHLSPESARTIGYALLDMAGGEA